ncbi:streptophobe family protein [Streptomyces sp. NPDC048518]|uniref:streptophobe family protein n=1 Tax=Streptomyces sp. NPDC048518 TaxID=3155029 RepID=UPI0033E9A662
MTAGEHKGEGRGVRWGDVLLSAVAAVSWALVGMAGTAALGLHLLGADAVGSLGPMTAATVALGAGGSVTPSGDVSAFGLDGAETTTTIDIAPLGVGLVGALLLAHFFLRSLRAAGTVIAPAELLARAGAVIALFVAMLAGLAWAGHDLITIDGERLGVDKGIDKGGDRLPGGIGDKLPGGLGDIGGLLPDRLGDLAKAKASVGFTVDTAPTLLGGAVWAAGVLLVALLASRRTPLPAALGWLHRVVRPAVSALVAVVLLAVAAGLAAAAYAMIGDDHPKRIAGAALLGAPNGVWLGIPVGLFVPWDGRATGALARFLPDPVDDLLTGPSDRALTLGRLAELDGRVWLLGVAAAVMMLFAGVLTAVRTPWVRGGVSVVGFAGRCGVRLGAATAAGLPLMAWLTGVSADASLSVLGFDAFGAGIELHGRLAPAALLGAAWGFGAGVAGALLACAAGAAGAGTGAGPGALAGVGVPGAPGVPSAGASAGAWGGGVGAPGGGASGGGAYGGGAYGAGAGAAGAGAAGAGAAGAGAAGAGAAGAGAAGAGAAGAGAAGERAYGAEPARPGSAGAGSAGPGSAGAEPAGPGPAGAGPTGAGPYRPGTPHRPPNPDTNPYLRPPKDTSGAPTVAGPLVPPPPPNRRRARTGDWPPPPPPPPPPPENPRRPRT